MSSDPHESAAWRTFGMLAANEAEAFEEAMRHDPELKNATQEMDRLAAAIAVTTAAPVPPRAGQLERLHLRLGLNVSKRTNWLGITGWAAAAVLAMILVLNRNPLPRNQVVEPTTIDPVIHQHESTMTPPEQELAREDNEILTRIPAAATGDGAPPTPRQEVGPRGVARVQTRQLIQEIEVLRDQLERILERDRERFEAIPGMAWPIVVQMRPPEKFTAAPSVLSAKPDDPPITSILGDALTAAIQPQSQVDPFAETVIVPPVAPAPVVEPSATPIYDTARDAGTLVVSNLPATTADEAYNLWVTTKKGNKPIHVGRLPESNVRGGESFDFSLGSKATVPSSFILTKDRLGAPSLPSGNNTVLVGPR
jgi:hypothetical protein